MYVGIDVHKQDAQVPVRNDAGDVVEEMRVRNANLDEVAQRYAGAEAAIEATSNYGIFKAKASPFRAGMKPT